MEVSLYKITPEVEYSIVEIARVSSKREDKQAEPEKLIKYLIDNRHWSPFEHGFMTLTIVTSRAIGTQILRHRSFTFQEFSQRYAAVEAIEPMEFRQQSDKNRQSSTDYLFLVDPGNCSVNHRDGYKELAHEVREHVENTQALYQKMLDKGVAKECARMILPMASQTTIHMSGPVRSWIHFMELRLDEHAQKEAQEIGRAVLNIFKQEFPLITKALGWENR